MRTGPFFTIAIALATALILPFAGLAQAADAQEEEDRYRYQSLTGTIDDDVFVAAETIDSSADINGDLFATGRTVTIAGIVRDLAAVAGWRVRLEGDVAGDTLTAGFTIDADGTFRDNLFASGGFVTIAGQVSGKAFASGMEVYIARNARIEDNVRLAGGVVEIAGHVQGDAEIAAADVIVRGRIDGNLTTTADDVEIMPTAIIGGQFLHRGPEPPRIASAATIGGDVQHIEGAGFERFERGAEIFGFAWSLITPIYLLLLGLLLYLLVPGFVQTSAEQLRRNPLASFGLGLLILVAGPMAAAILAATLLGLPFGLLLAAIYAVAALLAAPLFALSISWHVMRARGRAESRGAVLAGFAVLLLAWWLINFLPFIGGLISLVAVIGGLGAAGLEIYRLLRAGLQRPA